MKRYEKRYSFPPGLLGVSRSWRVQSYILIHLWKDTARRRAKKPTIKKQFIWRFGIARRCFGMLTRASTSGKLADPPLSRRQVPSAYQLQWRLLLCMSFFRDFGPSFLQDCELKKDKYFIQNAPVKWRCLKPARNRHPTWTIVVLKNNLLPGFVSVKWAVALCAATALGFFLQLQHGSLFPRVAWVQLGFAPVLGCITERTSMWWDESLISW